MQIFGIAVLIVFLAFFAFIITMMVKAARKTRELKQNLALSLGFRASEANEELLDRINAAYPEIRTSRKFELQNVFRKTHPDGEIFLFDLVDTAGEDDSTLEEGAVAIVSPTLHLPNLFVFPKSDQDGWATSLANAVLQWVVGRSGNLLEFPESQDFAKRYLVSSTEPEATYAFLRPDILNRLASTRLLSIAARNDILIVSSIGQRHKQYDRHQLVERINQALDIFTLFQQ